MMEVLCYVDNVPMFYCVSAYLTLITSRWMVDGDERDLQSCSCRYIIVCASVDSVYLRAIRDFF